MKMKDPAEIAMVRSSLERQLEALDDAEQAWADLSREQRLTEIFHRTFCKAKEHYSWNKEKGGYCAFDDEDWLKIPHSTKNAFLTQLTGIIRAMPEDVSEDKIVEVFLAVKKAVE